VTRMQRVPGHALDAQAVARDDEGVPLPPMGRHGKAVGRAQCSCGLLSPELPSGPDRASWHRDHKLDVLTDLVLAAGDPR
jgi:hypothetical protein